MLYRFPPNPVDATDPTFLVGGNETYAKLKVEAKAGKRTVLMTEHTLIFVIKGLKLLHFSGETIEVSPNSVFLLKKGIYVMAEYVEEGLSFEALILFLPQRMLRSFLSTVQPAQHADKITKNCLIIRASTHLQHFQTQLRHYFDHNIFDYSSLMPLKQQEALILLQATIYRDEINAFLRSAIRDGLEDLDFIVRTYLLQPITLAEMARLSNRSLATFKRDFQKLYSSAPRTWINRQRLEHARLLLENTDKPVTAVSQESGFNSTSHFIRLFKVAFHLTPGSVRAKTAIF
jgi:AraC family transcriptional regulator, exoenzyme S synthesis regulatory protein ExsA